MKFCAVVILLLLSSLAQAQPPRIDSMVIDESKRELSIYGEFGFSKGKVFCDSVELQVISWSDTVLVSAIKDTGRGHAGPVTVGAGGYLSNMRMLTQVLFAVSICDTHASADHCQNQYNELDKSNRTIYWRYDFHSFFINNKTDRQLQFTRGGSLVVYDFPNSLSSLGFITVANYYRFAISWDQLSGGGETSPISNNPYLKEAYDGIDLFAPPHEAFALYRPVSLLAPKNNNTNLAKDSIFFSWDSLQYIGGPVPTKYRIMVCTDSIFASVVVDTILSVLTFSSDRLKGSTTYFWRVAGINSEGQSRWSDVWKFTTGFKAFVQSDSSNYEFSVYPNPAKDILHINTSAGQYNFALYNLQGIMLKLFQPGITAIDVSAFPSGNYILGIIAGSQSYSTIVSIIR